MSIGKITLPLLITLSACSISDSIESAVIHAEDEKVERSIGTQSNPIPLNQIAVVGDWELKITKVNKNAELNQPISDKRQFVIADISLFRLGDESGQPWLDLGKQFESSTKIFNPAIASEDSCGNFENDINAFNEIKPGQQVSGKACVAVPVDHIQGNFVFWDLTVVEKRKFYFAVD